MILITLNRQFFHKYSCVNFEYIFAGKQFSFQKIMDVWFQEYLWGFFSSITQWKRIQYLIW